MVYENRRALGWTLARDEAFAPWTAAGLVPGRVSLEHNHVFRVLTGDAEWLAEAAGRLRHAATGRAELPVVGDWVAVRPPSPGGRARIEAVLPRAGAVSRQAAGRATGEQVMAANIDTLFLVSGLDAEFNPRRIERYLVVARRSGAEPVLVLNKADVRADVAAVVGEAQTIAPDVPVVPGQRPDGGWPPGPHALPAAGPHDCAAGFVRRRQVFHHQPADGPRGASDPRGARARCPRAPHERPPAAPGA